MVYIYQINLEILTFRHFEISKSRNIGTNKGFALLIAVIIATIVLTIGISIINTALKEVILASTVRNSLTSFYIADSGVECALYWDNIRGNFQVDSVFAPGSPPTTIECAGVTIDNVQGGSDVEFMLQDQEDPRAPCAKVLVSSVPVGPEEDNVVVRSEGSNTCEQNNSRRVERALEVKYSRFR